MSTKYNEYKMAEIEQIKRLIKTGFLLANDDTIELKGYKGYPDNPDKYKRDQSNNYKYQIGLEPDWYKYVYQSDELDGYYNHITKTWLNRKTPKLYALSQGCQPVYFKKYDFGFNSCFLVGSQQVKFRFHNLYTDLSNRFRIALNSSEKLHEAHILTYTGDYKYGDREHTEAFRKRLERGCYVSRYDWNLNFPKDIGKRLYDALLPYNQDQKQYPEPEQTIYLTGMDNSKATKIIFYNTKYKNSSGIDNYKLEITLRTTALVTPRVIGKDEQGNSIKSNFRDPKKFTTQPDIQQALRSYLKNQLKKYVIDPSGMKKELTEYLGLSNQKQLLDEMTDTKYTITNILKEAGQEDINTLMEKKKELNISAIKIEAWRGNRSNASLRELYLEGAEIDWFKNPDYPTPEETGRRNFVEKGYAVDAMGKITGYVSDAEFKRQDPESYERMQKAIKAMTPNRKRRW